MSRKGQIFQIQVVVDGATDEEAWANFQADPKKYLPTEMKARLQVTLANSSLRMVTSYGSDQEPKEDEKQFAHQHGWDVCRRYSEHFDTWSIFFVKSENVKVIWWNNGWAPWHSATGVFDNASWHSAIAALRVAEKMFPNG